MYRRMILAVLAVLIATALAGCAAVFGEPPTFEGQIQKFDAALAKYDNGISLYYKGDYAQARQEFSDASKTFKDCEAAYEEIMKQDVTGLERKISENMAGCSLQYAYTAAYMRDAAAAAAGGDMARADLMKDTAREYEMVARQGYEANKAAIEEMRSNAPR